MVVFIVRKWSRLVHAASALLLLILKHVIATLLTDMYK